MIDRLNAALSGRYRIEREAGAGGMATVYRADDLKHGRTVALKVLRPELASVVGGDRFLTEIRTTAQLQHPHILPLFDSGQDDGLLWYAMPWIDGETLRQHLDREKQLPVDEAVRIGREVADALDHAHRRGIVHRDIKPANILLNEGRALVADFGIALAVSGAGDGRMTETGLSLGTPWYMSPEQASADRDVSPRSDLYSLGAVVYEMLAGQPPHAGPGAGAVLVKILTEDPPPLPTLRRTVPPHVAGAVTRAMEKLPADRFASAAEFAERLGDEGYRYLPASVRSGAAPRGAADPSAFRGRGLVVALALATLLASAVALAGWIRTPADPPSRVLTLKLEVGDAEFGPMDYAVAADGSTFVVAEIGVGLRVRSSEDPVFVTLPGTAGASNPTFSPDGRRITYSRNGAIEEVPVRGGQVRTVIPRPADGPLVQANWATDGTLVAAGPGGTFLLPPGGAEARELGERVVLMGDYRTPALLPDASGILFAGLTSAASADLRLLDLRADSVVELGLQGWRPQYVASGHILYADGDGILFAAPFDVDARRVTGPPVRLLDGIATGLQTAGFMASDEGTLLAERGGSYALGQVTIREYAVATGEEIGLLLDQPGPYEDARYSPDGDRLAVEVTDGPGFQIHVLDRELSALSQLTFVGDNHQPVWSPDGRAVAFTSEREGTAGEDVWLQAADGTSEARSHYSGDEELHVEDWAADSLMVVSRTQGSPYRDEVFVLPARGPIEPRPLDLGPGGVGSARVSPDGRWIAYETDAGGDFAIFVRPFPEGEGRWRLTPGLAAEPRWAPDGRSLYYITEAGVERAELRLDPSPVVTGRRIVTDEITVGSAWTFWDLHPDGDRFVLGRVGGGVALGGELWVTLNWQALLEGSTGR